MGAAATRMLRMMAMVANGLASCLSSPQQRGIDIATASRRPMADPTWLYNIHFVRTSRNELTSPEQTMAMVSVLVAWRVVELLVGLPVELPLGLPVELLPAGLPFVGLPVDVEVEVDVGGCSTTFV